MNKTFIILFPLLLHYFCILIFFFHKNCRTPILLQYVIISLLRETKWLENQVLWFELPPFISLMHRRLLFYSKLLNSDLTLVSHRSQSFWVVVIDMQEIPTAPALLCSSALFSQDISLSLSNSTKLCLITRALLWPSLRNHFSLLTPSQWLMLPHGFVERWLRRRHGKSEKDTPLLSNDNFVFCFLLFIVSLFKENN